MIIDQQTYDILQQTTQRVLDHCRIKQDIIIDGQVRQLILHVPSGDFKYNSFWIRDASMMASSGLIPSGEILGWLQLIAAGQNGHETRILANGLKVLPWSIADHINFDGQPVFFPGTYSSGHDQGNGSYGYYPPCDNAYYFIELARQYYHLSGDIRIFTQSFSGIRLLDRLESAFGSTVIDPDRQLCRSIMPEHTVDWGFCDAIAKSGLLLYPSLLRHQAAICLADLHRALNAIDKAADYLDLAEQIKSEILRNFSDESGWLLSATEVCRQKDVWGTAYAVWTGALEGDHLQQSLNALANGYQKGNIVNDFGYIRHISEDEDAFPGGTAWETGYRNCRYNVYQNGGYWAAPIGWYLYALSCFDQHLVGQMLYQYMEHCQSRAQDGAPFEWISRDGSTVDGRLYGASAALPFAAVRRIISGKCDFH